jgi:hypothetical protein
MVFNFLYKISLVNIWSSVYYSILYFGKISVLKTFYFFKVLRNFINYFFQKTFSLNIIFFLFNLYVNRNNEMVYFSLIINIWYYFFLYIISLVNIWSSVYYSILYFGEILFLKTFYFFKVLRNFLNYFFSKNFFTL